MSSSGGGGGGFFPGMFGPATPIPDLPVAGKNSTIGDPYQYGKFQNFLPDIKAEGLNDNATGLRPDMFKYRGPGGVTEGDTSNNTMQGGDVSSQIQDLRNQLAQLQQQGGLNNLQHPTTWFGGVPQVGGAAVDTWTNRS
jgi:hypothetical protein